MRVSLLPLLLLFCGLPIVTAFSSIAAPPMMGSQVASASLGLDPTLSRTVADSGAWRIVLNIGREAFSTMPFGWGASGGRLPLVIKADFNSDGQVVPRDINCRFTGPGGEVVKPIREGTWSTTNDKKLEFSLNFPERIERRDVSLDAGTEIVCEGLVYSTDVIKELNDKFYQAREKTWKAGKELNDISRRKEAAKKWDGTKWVKRYDDEPIWSQIGKRLQLMKAQGESRKKNAERPSPQSLSLDHGPFPGFDNNVYIQKEGVIKIPGKGVIGKWSAEPINDRPASYYR